MVNDFAEELRNADAGPACGAGYGELSLERVIAATGYREREWHTRVVSMELIVKCRAGAGPVAE